MIDPLEGPRTKVARAKQHIEDFQLARQRFLDTRPYRVGVKDDANTRKHIYYVTKVDPVPPDIAAIAGDVIQSLRSALDYIAYRAVIVGLGHPPPNPRDVAYPIAGNAAEYPSLRDGKVKGARQDAINAIDATKPYKGGNDTLWFINELNQIDKHRLLLNVGSAYQWVNVGPVMESNWRRTMPDWAKDIEFPALRIRPAGRLFPLKVGDELFIDSIDNEVNEKMDFGFDIAIHEPQVIESDSLLKTLQEMVDVVDGLLPGFEKILT